MHQVVWIVLLLCNLASCQNIDLSTKSDGIKWTLRSHNGSVSVAAVVPGGVYSDLMRAGVIDDVFVDFNDVKSRWVAYTPWTYTVNFNVTSDQLSARAARLVFQGLDTVAFIELNGQPIATTDNMFVTQAIPVKTALKVGENTLNVTFDSAVRVAKARSSEHFVAPDCVPESYHGECHANQLRKMQASFGWDWGPALPSVGIWKPVRLEFINTAVIRHVTTDFTELDQSWQVRLSVTLETGSDHAAAVDGFLAADITVDSRAKLTVGTRVDERSGKDGSVHAAVVLTVSKNQVSLWWPNGYGDQPLYPVRIYFMDENSTEVSTKNIHIGFRTVELVQENANLYTNGSFDSDGLVFYFKVNGYRMFMKGSNWVPASILPEHTYNETVVDHLLRSAASAHMSMLRVWGGGVYESDYFYEKCDQLGILVWQDLMFACSMYPADANFLRSVSKEVHENVLRLQHHPSIALWAGNNENEAALGGNWYGTKNDFSRYKDEYIRLYVNTIKPLVNKIDPARHYLCSSPSNGKRSEDEGYIAKNPYDSHYGDTHYYNYLADGWSMSTYPHARFSSEYGFQSLPSMKTWKSATKKADNLEWGSDFLKHRQHLLGGNAFLKSAVDLHLLLPLSDGKYFEKLVFYSQIAQAMSVKAETEFYRQSRSDWYTMGALYWQLNDVWQAPSWSSIEFGGDWKILHYFARNFFAPVLVSPELLPSGDIDVYVINDKLVPQDYAIITIEKFKYDNITAFHTEDHVVNVKPLDAIKTDIRINSLDIHHNKSIFYRFSMKSSEGVQISPYNYAFPVAFKMVSDIKHPNITIQVKKLKTEKSDFIMKYHYRTTVTTDTVILFLWLEAEGISGHFTDNGLIVTEKQTQIDFITNEHVEATALKNSISFKYYYHSPELTPVYS